jgi:virginiamycin B lyase
VQMFDAQGNTILGSYTQPVTLKDADTTGVTQLSGTTINASSAKPVTLSYSGARFTSTTITATASQLPAQTVSFAPNPSVVAEYQVPTINTNFGPQPQGINAITLGPDGNMWMVADGHSALDKVSPTGAITIYPLPSDGDGAESIAVGPDHELWFCESYNATIGKMTTNGAVTEYAIPYNSNTEFSQAAIVIAGPDGNMWMLDQGLNAVFKVTPSGNFTRYNLPQGPKHAPFYGGIAFGPDGNLWATDGPDDDVVVMSTSGSVVATYTFQYASYPQALVVGPDKNMWIAESLGNRIARMTVSGTRTEYNMPSGASYPWQLVAGPDGNIWFAEYGFGNYGGPVEGLYGGGKFGYITPDNSTIRDFGTNQKVDPQNDLHVVGLAFDPTGKLWLAQSAVNNIDMVETVIY